MVNLPFICNKAITAWHVGNFVMSKSLAYVPDLGARTFMTVKKEKFDNISSRYVKLNCGRVGNSNCHIEKELIYMAEPKEKRPEPEPPDIKKKKEQEKAEKLAKEAQEDIVRRAIQKRFGGKDKSEEEE